ncbi:MAG: hypothetical protein HC881_23485 [Leptolyngbyaceae cyanobacterium SL_7_1]|nr:hypothetical protein [Leptolyngbyaceae cyanobacterium SL_7_1]
MNLVIAISTDATFKRSLCPWRALIWLQQFRLSNGLGLMPAGGLGRELPVPIHRQYLRTYPRCSALSSVTDLNDRALLLPIFSEVSE